jgi:muramoyltetrapeptide carboxypeptidase
MQHSIRIGIVAPGSRIDPDLAARVSELAKSLCADRVSLRFHPQCFLSSGHFAGTDVERLQAFVESANDEKLAALWFARGGYGSARIAERAMGLLSEAARRKAYFGYSDAGALLGPMYRAGFKHLFHAPMPVDLLRSGGEGAIARVLAFLVEGDRRSLEPSVGADHLTAAFNLTILGHMIGTPFEPDLSGHEVMLEEVSEHMYRIDRALLHVMSAPSLKRCAGIRLGRCSDIPENDPDFGKTPEEVVRHRCEQAEIAYLGSADIGHDVDNKIVPFGRLAPL